MAKIPKTYKVTAKISAGPGYKPLFRRGICIANNELEVKKFIEGNTGNWVETELDIIVSVTKIERIPTQFICSTVNK
ncbi:MAG: hypothetical protein PHQ74_15045 [Crocinitomicaceae bacterium]|nr:hypothetical protein [Crocinitomicaceae bacterium]